MPLPVQVLLVDDNPGFIAPAVRFLSALPQVKVVGCACSGEEALDLVARLSPDLVLMDLALPGMNGLEATARLRSRPDAPRVIMVTLYDTPEYRAAARVAGADGYVSKSDFGTDLLPMILSLFASPIESLAACQEP
jgi:DNA-binding NarL/FixJ family response regulator